MRNRERLAVDRTYWEECGAPAGTTHHCPMGYEGTTEWEKWENDTIFEWAGRGSWRVHTHGYENAEDRIEKPESWWENGKLPPIGSPCSILPRGRANGVVINHATHYGDLVAVVQTDLCVEIFAADCLHPVETERLRNERELAEFLATLVTPQLAGTISKSLVEEGYTKPV